MQLSAIKPGTTVGTATFIDSTSKPGAIETFTADVHVGRVLRAGVSDIRATGWELIRLTHDPKPGRSGTTWGTVGFIRNGDAWDAVELLAPTRPGGPERVLWSPFDMRSFQLAPGVQLDAVWQISHYGGDYTSMLPPFTRPS